MQIKGLEAELKKQDAQEKVLKNGEDVKSTESYLQLVRNDSFLNIIPVPYEKKDMYTLASTSEKGVILVLIMHKIKFEMFM